MTVLIHAFLGVRTVVLDYVHWPVVRTGTAVAALRRRRSCCFILGTQVIVTLPIEALTTGM